MSSNSDKIKVKWMESEGEFHLKTVEGIKVSWLKVGLNTLGGILTCGVWILVLLILCSWNSKIVKRLLYCQSPVDKCTHFYVSSNHG